MTLGSVELIHKYRDLVVNYHLLLRDIGPISPLVVRLYEDINLIQSFLGMPEMFILEVHAWAKGYIDTMGTLRFVS